MLLNQEKTDRLLALLKRRYPRWSGFSDQRFVRDTAALRPDALEGIELLNEAGLRQLAQERRWDEIIGRVDFVARSAHGQCPNSPDLSELEPLHDPKLDKAAFCESILDLMFGDGDSPSRLQRYADLARAHGFPAGWGLPTLLLMLVHPFTDCFIRADAFSWFLEFAGRPFSVGSVRGDSYNRLVKLAREVAIHFEDGSMVEMPVIQRLIWICFIEHRAQEPAAPATPAPEPARIDESVKPDETVTTLVIEPPSEADALARRAAAADGLSLPDPSFQIINIDKENEDAMKGPGAHHKDAAFHPDAFEMLEAMGEAPLSQKADKSRRDAALEKPALALVREVLSRLPERVRTQFFSVPLTAYGSERSRAFLNVSFYRKGGKWRGEPQLFFIIGDDGIECGYSIEWYMGVYLERFRANFSKNESLMVAWLEEAASDQIGLRASRVRGPDGSIAYRADSFVGDNQEVRISVSVTRDQILGWSKSRLVSSLVESIVRLFPVLQLALDEDPFADRTQVAAEPPVSAAQGETAAAIPDPAHAADDDTPAEEIREPATVAVAEEAAVVIESIQAAPAPQDVAIDAAVADADVAVEAALAEDFDFDDAARLEPEPVEDVVESIEAEADPVAEHAAAEPEAPVDDESETALKIEPEAVEEFEDDHDETDGEELPPAASPSVGPDRAGSPADEKPGNLLEILAREVEGKSWKQPIRPVSPAPGAAPRRIDIETGSGRAAARAREAAVLEEFEVLGLRHRINAEYPLAQCAADSGFAESQLKDWLEAIDRKGQAVFFGPPGTGKTYMAEKLARHMIGGSDGFTRLIQLHAGVTYDDFIEARRPSAASSREAKTFAIPGRFVEFCREAESRGGACVLILDEMHRADIANVVGELLYLLEHRDQELQLTGGTRFRVPSNVRVIGTMNTADRSNAFLDTAIRRRFAFLELGPRYEVLRHYHRDSEDMPVEQLIGVLETVNRRIANKRFEIGIAYFLREGAGRDLESIWRTEIEPLVGDYFFDQPGAADAFTWDAIRQHLGR